MLCTVGNYLVYLVCFIFSMCPNVFTASFFGLLLVCQSIGYSHCIWKHKCQMFPIVCRLSLINAFSEGSNNNTIHIEVYKIQSLWHAVGCIRNNF